MKFPALVALLIALPGIAGAEVRHDDGIGIYVGIDGRQTIPTGVYTGLANPTANRLIFLFDHGDHFHGIGAYSYTGPAGAPTIVPTSTNNRLPEITSGESPLPLTAGAAFMLVCCAAWRALRSTVISEWPPSIRSRDMRQGVKRAFFSAPVTAVGTARSLE